MFVADNSRTNNSTENIRERARRVKVGIVRTSIFSSVLYAAWGIWPLIEWLTFEQNRRDFCGSLHDYGTIFSIACIASSFLIASSLISFHLCNPEGRCFVCSVVPLFSHVLTFLIAFGVTVQGSIFLWSRKIGETSPGDLCKLESEMFFRGAELYTQITFGMLFVELLACIYLTRIIYYLCKNGNSIIEVVFDELETSKFIDENNGNASTRISIAPSDSVQIVGMTKSSKE